MELRVIIAIVRPGVLEPVEKRLQELGVRGITVSKTKGWEEYANFFSRDWMVDQVRIEIFTERDRAEMIAAAIAGAAHTGSPGDGIVAILPVDKVFSVRTRSEAIPNRLPAGQ